MASHGHRGVARLVLGSVTSQVLNQCRIPVLAYRRERGRLVGDTRHAKGDAQASQ
jgi:hypothetical protein